MGELIFIIIITAIGEILMFTLFDFTDVLGVRIKNQILSIIVQYLLAISIAVGAGYIFWKAGSYLFR